LTYANAGHPAGMLVRSGEDRALGEGGPPLGLLANAIYLEERIVLAAGDVCAFMTDGITEAFDDGLRPWRPVVLDAVREGRHSAWAVCNEVMSRAQRAHGPNGVEGWTDDRTVVVIAVNGN
jgi:serine phosphatase RsbU (regulator of sigma subunit)